MEGGEIYSDGDFAIRSTTAEQSQYVSYSPSTVSITGGSIHGATAVYVADGNATSAIRQSDGRYLVTIANTSAHRLSDNHVVEINAGGKCTVTLSALSYAKVLFDSYNNDSDAQNVAASLYYYHKWALANNQS